MAESQSTGKDTSTAYNSTDVDGSSTSPLLYLAGWRTVDSVAKGQSPLFTYIRTVYGAKLVGSEKIGSEVS